MAASRTVSQGDILAGRYQLVARLGEGGAGVVWRAHDRLLERAVAVKLLHPQLADDAVTAARFRSEAAAAARLTHHNAVTVYDIARDGDRDYLVMELVDGATLEDLLRLGQIRPATVALLGRCVASALGTAHQHGLVHRDVKPANVLLTADGVPKVADFGIARALGEMTSRLTTPGTVVGTARYLSPEQLRDEAVDARADVYSVGLLLHQALTGRPPWGEGSALEVASRRLTGDLPAATADRDDVPPGLDEVVARATRLDPDHRYHDGADLAAALSPFADGSAGSELARLVQVAVGADQPQPGTPARGERPDVPVGGERSRTSVIPPARDRPPAPSRTPPARRPQAPERRPPAEERPPGGRPPPTARRLRRRRRTFAVATVVIAALLVAILAFMDVPLPGFDTEPVEVAVVEASDHDPLGDGRERPDLLEGALDGDPGTAWTTETYEREDLIPPSKDGVGIWFDLGETHDVRRIDLGFAVEGTTFEVWAGDEPPEPGTTPADWGERVDDPDAPPGSSIEVGGEHTGRVWLLWFTQLAPVDGGFRAELSTITFLARVS